MATYKNIRIKVGKKPKGKDTRKTRLQRVKVLASGKFKFVKNLTKSRSKSKSSKTSSTKRKTKSNPKGGKNRMGKSKSLVTTATQLAKAGAILLPAAIAVTSPGDVSHKARLYLTFMSGIEIDRGGNAKFRAERLLTGWGPYVGVSVGSKIASKINGLIRRI